MTTPFFSVVIPTYNRAHLIEKTIRTILDQNFADFEVLVVDDGSNDNTDQVVKAISDSRITYYKKDNAERAVARNFGSARAKGKYVTFFDSDDLMYVHHLQSAYEFIVEHKNPEWFHFGFDYKDPDDTVIMQPDPITESIQKSLLFDNRLSCNGVFLRKDIADQYKFQEDRALSSSEDWELWIRLICNFPLKFSTVVTTSVVEHELRSLNTVKPETIEKRDLILIDKLQVNPTVQAVYKRDFLRFKAERYTFFMLRHAEAQNRKKVISWASKAALTYFPAIFTRRFLAALKNSIIG